MRYMPLIFLCLICVFPGTNAHSEQAKGGADEIVNVLRHPLIDAPLFLRGQVRYRYWGFSVYDVALYTERNADSLNPYQSPGALVLRYARSISREDFTRAAQNILAAHDPALLARLDPVFQRWNDLLEPVQDGDEYAMYYSPGGTLSLFRNGVFKGEVNDLQFMKAYLGIWMDEYSVLGSDRLTLFSSKEGERL